MFYIFAVQQFTQFNSNVSLSALYHRIHWLLSMDKI